MAGREGRNVCELCAKWKRARWVGVREGRRPLEDTVENDSKSLARRDGENVVGIFFTV